MGSLVLTAPDSARQHFPAMVPSDHINHSHHSTATTTASSPSAPRHSHDPAETASTSRNTAERPSPHIQPNARRPGPSAHSTPTNAARASTPMSSSQTAVESSREPSRTRSADPSHAPNSSPPRIKIRDLKHIQSFCADAHSPMSYLQSPPGPTQHPSDSDMLAPQYEISKMPVTDVIEMVAGLLTKITTTNDSQAEQLHRNIPTGPEAAAGMSAQTSSVLAFHGKNVPTISIMSYLSRIHKYCPATYEVFLSLLVYFDRITEKINSAPTSATRKPDDEQPPTDREGNRSSTADRPTTSGGTDSGKEDSSDASDRPTSSSLPSPPLTDLDPMSLAHFFVVDSYNIHRLVIAGVTCASKFFSDVFYTNSRYAKVGGLPLVELNHLELQFLVLNDFRLSIPVEELEAYATMLVEFYAREVLAQRREDDMQGVQAGG